MLQLSCVPVHQLTKQRWGGWKKQKTTTRKLHARGTHNSPSTGRDLQVNHKDSTQPKHDTSRLVFITNRGNTSGTNAIIMHVTSSQYNKNQTKNPATEANLKPHTVFGVQIFCL